MPTPRVEEDAHMREPTSPAGLGMASAVAEIEM